MQQSCTERCLSDLVSASAAPAQRYAACVEQLGCDKIKGRGVEQCQFEAMRMGR